jgi:predicted transposase/invertase (TIGR01784 family)
MKAKYLNPFTDFGFKKLFGEEASKPLLTDFLNALLPAENRIKSLTFKNTERLAEVGLERKAVYDIYCENERGEKFIVELQKAKQNYFKERTIYLASFSPSGSTFSTFPIREQAEKGNWDFHLKAVYCIGVLDFTFDDYDTDAEKHRVIHTIKLKNQDGKTFYDKLTYIYLEMPNFVKTQKQLKSRLDKWLFFIKNLEDLKRILTIFQDKIFTTAFEKAELANLRVADLNAYEMNLKVYRDYKNTVDYAYDEGRTEGHLQGEMKGIQKGMQKGILKTAKELKRLGVSPEIISKSTGLSKAAIRKL